MENKENLKIMSRTIEEIRQYFEERPELKDTVNKYLKENGYLFESVEGMINEVCGGEDNPQGYADKIYDVLSSMEIYDVLSSMERKTEDSGVDMPGEGSKASEEFSWWYIGEREEHPVICYKGFNKDLTCRGFQYEVGKEYENDRPIWACLNGFHACQFPLDVLEYYDGWGDRYCVAEQWGHMETHGDKTASSNIKILNEVGLKKLFEEATTKMRMRCEIGEEASYERGEWSRVKLLEGKVTIAGKKCCLVLKYEEGWGSLSFLDDEIGDIIGDDNIIGVMKGCRKFDILGANNKIYFFSNNNRIRIIGELNCVNIVEGVGNAIVMTGSGNAVRANGVVDVTLVGDDNSAIAGIGSTINFVNRGKMISIVIDGKDYTENDIIVFSDGEIEKKKSVAEN